MLNQLLKLKLRTGYYDMHTTSLFNYVNFYDDFIFIWNAQELIGEFCNV